MKRDDVRAALELGWGVLREKELEEILIPLVRALAWTYNLNQRWEDAVAILTKIWNLDKAFSFHAGGFCREPHLRRQWQPNLIPIGMLLGDLIGNGRRDSVLSEVKSLKAIESGAICY